MVDPKELVDPDEVEDPSLAAFRKRCKELRDARKKGKGSSLSAYMEQENKKEEESLAIRAIKIRNREIDLDRREKALDERERNLEERERRARRIISDAEDRASEIEEEAERVRRQSEEDVSVSEYNALVAGVVLGCCRR